MQTLKGVMENHKLVNAKEISNTFAFSLYTKSQTKKCKRATNPSQQDRATMCMPIRLKKNNDPLKALCQKLAFSVPYDSFLGNKSSVYQMKCSDEIATEP